MNNIEAKRKKFLSGDALAYIVKQSKKYQDALAKVNKVAELSEKGQKAQNIIKNSDFGCQKDNIYDLIGLILDENIRPGKLVIPEIPMHAVIVNLSDNDWGIDEVILNCTIPRDDEVVEFTMNDGITNYGLSITDCRYKHATKAQITKFITDLSLSLDDDDFMVLYRSVMIELI